MDKIITSMNYKRIYRLLFFSVVIIFCISPPLHETEGWKIEKLSALRICSERKQALAEEVDVQGSTGVLQRSCSTWITFLRKELRPLENLFSAPCTGFPELLPLLWPNVDLIGWHCRVSGTCMLCRSVLYSLRQMKVCLWVRWQQTATGSHHALACTVLQSAHTGTGDAHPHLLCQTFMGVASFSHVSCRPQKDVSIQSKFVVPLIFNFEKYLEKQWAASQVFSLCCL